VEFLFFEKKNSGVSNLPN